MDNLFSTHPNTANRIAELERLAAEMGSTSYGVRARSLLGAVERRRGRTIPRGPWG